MDEHAIRLQAFAKLEELQAKYGYEIPRRPILEEGFDYQGRPVPFMSRQRGIWAPQGFRYALSITTSPNNPYEDSRTEDGLIAYHFFKDDPNLADNVKLRAALQDNVPLIYFSGIRKNIYEASWPAFVVGEDRGRCLFQIAIDTDSVLRPQTRVADSAAVAARRQYQTAQVMVRLHQHQFRSVVLQAYTEACALCSLRHVKLLDAAHIIPDSEERGLPVVNNGIALCKIHHAAYDTNIMGITPDYLIEVNEEILRETDGPMLRHGIQELHGQKIHLPRKMTDWPDKDRLAERHKKFHLGA